MKISLNKLAAFALFTGLTFAGDLVQAQNRIGLAVQQGNGAYVQKTDRVGCTSNAFLGIPTLAQNGCVNMKQVKFIVAPSGQSSSVWKGTVPAESRPSTRITFNSTYTEEVEGPTKGLVYNTVAVTEPNGDVTFTLTARGNKMAGKAASKK
ncbi:hypothetical protein GCM10022409_46790 [Hymenobacter glaciei]|uniref:Uncharacterized protein n=1 Tax=Hymenobacter glaciei TaxID=877209 RepID=A0ABP7UWA5_9BACT